MNYKSAFAIVGSTVAFTTLVVGTICLLTWWLSWVGGVISLALVVIAMFFLTAKMTED